MISQPWKHCVDQNQPHKDLTTKRDVDVYVVYSANIFRIEYYLYAYIPLCHEEKRVTIFICFGFSNLAY